MMRTIICSVLLTFTFFANVAAQKKDTYCNARFGFCIDYDASLLRIQPEAQNGDGCVFKDHTNKVRLTVSGSGDWNFGNDGEVISLEALYHKELASHPGVKVTYKLFRKTFFIISGTAKGKVFYEKVIKRPDAFCTAYLDYTPSEQSIYEHVASLIAQSFR